LTRLRTGFIALAGRLKIESVQGHHPAKGDGMGVRHRAHSRQPLLSIVCTMMSLTDMLGDV
jgi:hypothetical protein